MKLPFRFSFWSQKGFTLLEFVVASSLALLLTAIVTSMYFYTNRLNHIAQTDLKIQEDLRQISQLIAKDASLAGNFGCLSLSSLYQVDSRNINNKFNREFHVFFNKPDTVSSAIVFDRPSSSATENNQNFGVNILPFDELKVAGFTQNNSNAKALVFYYGTGNTGVSDIKFGQNGNKIDSITFKDGNPYNSLEEVAKQGGYLALSSCQALNIFKAGQGHQDLSFTNGDFGDVRISYEDETNKQKISEITLLRYVVHAYAVGSYQGQYGLYRIELKEDGSWDMPILLSENVAKMEVSFIYPTSLNDKKQPIGCPSAFSNDIFNNENQTLIQKFNAYSFYEKSNATFAEPPNPNNQKKEQGVDLINILPDEYFLAPAAVNVVLTLDYPNLKRPFGLGNDNKGNSSEGSRIDIATGKKVNSQTFRIFSSIKGGNQCANRNLIE